MSSIPSVFSQKVQKAAREIEPSLQRANGEAIGTIPDAEAYIWARLTTLGIYQDEGSYDILMSSDCSEGDARRVFCENGEPNLPVARFKRMWSILKGEARQEAETLGVGEALDKALKANRPIGQWTDEDLLKAYSPDCNPEVIENLDKRAKERSFIVFSNEEAHEVDSAATVDLLRMIRRGKPTPVHYPVNGTLRKLYRAGDFPNSTMLECPLHPGTLLVNGYCDQCGQTWDVSDYERLQLARIIRDRDEGPETPAAIKEFIAAMTKGDLAKIGETYPKAMVEYNERKTEEDLPRLKVRQAARGVSDPMNPSLHRRF